MLRRNLGVGLGSLLWANHALAASQPGSKANDPAPPNVLANFGIAQDAVQLIGGAAIGTYTKLIDDMATVLRAFVPDMPHVLPVISTGGLEQIYYAVHLDNIGGGLMSGVVLDVVRRGGWLPEVTERLTYVTQLYQEEVHIIAKGSLNSVFDLNGRTVNTGPLNSGTDLIARRLFELLDINPVYDDRPTAAALQGVTQGDPEAVVFIAGKPVIAVQNLKSSDDLRLLHLPWNIGTARHLADSDFRPAFFQHNDYPNLVPPDTKVPTVGSAVYLMTKNGPTNPALQRLVSGFTTSLLQNLSVLQKESSITKWRDADLIARLPHFRRAPEVAAWFADPTAKGPERPSSQNPARPARGPNKADAGPHLQLGAFGSEAAARNEWARLQHALPNMLAGYEPSITAGLHDGSTVWRLRIGGFADLAAAGDLCSQLRSAATNCFVLRG